jgi:uncharacterized protein (TIGR02466 family)
MEVMALFPTPVSKWNYGQDFSKEIEFINDKFTKDVRRNAGGNFATTNVRVLNYPELNNISEFINSCLQEYLEKVISPTENVKPYVTLSWINFTNKDQSHHRHWHGNSLVSGVFYLNANKDIDKITFHKEHQSIIEFKPSTFNLFNSQSWWVPVGTGDLILFPSTLIHEVDKVVNNETRISLSFNTFVKGELGNEQYLNFLDI